MHQALKEAHAEGKQIQALVQFYIGFTKQWVDVAEPMWKAGTEYRVKPEQSRTKWNI